MSIIDELNDSFANDLQAKIDGHILDIANDIKKDPVRLKKALDYMCEKHVNAVSEENKCCDDIHEVPPQNKIKTKKFEDNSIKDTIESKKEKLIEIKTDNLVDEIMEFIDKIGDKISIEVCWE